MVTILFAIFSVFAFRFRSRAALELKLVALEHQLAVLRRLRPGRPQLSSLDRLLWVVLYRLCPKVIDAMVLVRPATVVDWHRRGFRFYWRWRSCRPGRPAHYGTLSVGFTTQGKGPPLISTEISPTDRRLPCEPGGR
jgi:putative transposase